MDGVLRATPAMAAPQGPVREAKKPVKKMRLIPAEKAFAFARKLQGAPGCRLDAQPGPSSSTPAETANRRSKLSTRRAPVLAARARIS